MGGLHWLTKTWVGELAHSVALLDLGVVGLAGIGKNGGMFNKHGGNTMSEVSALCNQAFLGQ